MSHYDRNSSFGYGRGVARSTTAEIDEGLRSLHARRLQLHDARPRRDRPRRARHLYARQPDLRRRPAGGALALRPDALHDAAALGGDAGAAGASCSSSAPAPTRMSAASARNLFLAFSAVMGLSMSSILLVFTGVSVARVFFITAAAFGGLSIYGYMTKRDLSAFGSFLVMGVWGLVIAGLVNLFLQSSGLQFALSILSRSDLLRPHRLGHAEHQGHVLSRATATRSRRRRASSARCRSTWTSSTCSSRCCSSSASATTEQGWRNIFEPRPTRRGFFCRCDPRALRLWTAARDDERAPYSAPTSLKPRSRTRRTRDRSWPRFITRPEAETTA